MCSVVRTHSMSERDCTHTASTYGNVKPLFDIKHVEAVYKHRKSVFIELNNTSLVFSKPAWNAKKRCNLAPTM